MKRRSYITIFFLLLTIMGVYSQSMTISGGNSIGVVICSKGYVYAWGYNKAGSPGTLNTLGLEPTLPEASQEKVYAPAKVNTGSLTFSQVTAGSGATIVALACNSLVYAWGDNMHKQCGQGDVTTAVTVPSPVLKPEADTYGYNINGERGIGAEYKYLGGVTFVAASTAAAFAITEDGRLVGWGGNNSGSGWITADVGSPVYIKDKDGNDLQNVLHIVGGDDNCIIIVGNSLTDKSGQVFSIGNCNGQSMADDITQGVTYAGPVVDVDGNYLMDVKICGAMDVGAFAVTGDGYLYGWGNTWSCCSGWNKGTQSRVAMKVPAGDYAAISRETYLTNVIQVVGGNGYGACVTKDGYVLYWGNATGGGSLPSENVPTEHQNCSNGAAYPIFAEYCDGTRVDDAVAIARGDQFGFIVNNKDEFYAWGLNSSGQLGIGTTDTEVNCLQKIDVPCDVMDPVPSVFLLSKYEKCPTESIVLDCEFTIPIGKEDRYFVQWTYNDVVLNTSKATDLSTVRANDVYNKTSITVPATETGDYKVLLSYISDNVACNVALSDSAFTEVVNLEQPFIGTVDSSCVIDALNPDATDNVCFGLNLNTTEYASYVSNGSAFIVYSDETGGSPIDTLYLDPGESAADFCVAGNYVTAHDNAPVDTTYTIWVEDATKFVGVVNPAAFADLNAATTFDSYNPTYTKLTCYSNSIIDSIGVYITSASEDIVVTWSICDEGLNSNGITCPGSVILTSDSYTISPSADGFYKIPVNLAITGSASKPVSYYLTYTLKNTSGANTGAKFYSTEVTSAIADELDGLTLYVNGGATPWGTSNYAFYNIYFSKSTTYDCGRMEMSSVYWCPPCSRPTIKTSGKYVEIESTQAPVADTIRLCKETPDITLSVNDVKNTTGASFDILWFDNEANMTNDLLAIESDLSGTSTSSSISVGWNDLTPGQTTTYYVKVRDHEKSDASSCYVFDSIKVKADTVPIVPTIDIESFCEGSDIDVSSIVSQFHFEGFASEVKDADDSVLDDSDLATSISALTEGTVAYSVIITDNSTGCISASSSVSITVLPIPVVPVVADQDYVVSSGQQEISDAATALTGNTLMWYGDGTTYTTPGVTVAPSVPLTSEGEYVYWVTQTNADGCESDTSRVTVTVNDSPVPATSDTMVCVNSAVDLSDLVEAEDATYTLNWFTESTAAKGMGSSAVPSVNTSVPGSYDFYVSQTNSQTTAESNKSKITVDVYGVKAPDAGSDISVCAGDPAISITGTMVSDAASYYGADAALLWYEGGSLLSTAPSPSTNVTATTEYIYAAGQTYTLSTGEVCSGPLDSVKVTVNYTEKPTVSDNIIYMMSDTTADGKNMNATLLTQAGASISTGLTNYTYNWYSSDGTLIGNDVTPAAPADKTQDAVITYYLSVTNTDTNCESDTIAVTVEIYSSPSPSTATVYYCKDATATELTATKGTPLNGGSVDDYVLVWYDTDGTTALATAPTPLTTTVGKQTYYVSQKNSQTGSESGKVKADVIVYDVKTPTVGADLSYCKGETPITLSYTEEKDEAAYYMADGFIWTVNKADQAVGTVPTISTDVASTTTTTYGVRQTYTLQSGEVCEGEEETFEVTVTAVEAPTGSYQANYVRIDAVNNGGTFPNNLTIQSPTVATASAGCELLWYDATGTLIGDGMTAPTPEYNSSWPAGTDEVLTYYVAQRDIATNCVSEKKQVTVTISDSPMPITSQLSYCVGDAAQNATFVADLQSAVTINYSANATGNYSLLWFATETESKTNPTNGVTTPTLVPTTDAAGVQKFYVCQYDNENKAMSSPSTVTVTVYAVPVLTTTATTPVCSQDGAVVTVDLNSGYSTDIVTTAAFYSDAAATTKISASVITTGTYYARGSYMPTTTLTCYSNVSDIYVDIQDLQTPVITGETLTCPSTAITLSAAATSTNPGASAITYSWMGSDGSTGTTAAFTSGTLSSTPGDSYSFTVTAKVGVCTGLSATHVVKINDAPVDGTLTVTEANNSLSPLSITTQTGGQFYSCGGELTMAAAFTKTEGDYTWYRGGSSMGTGDQQIVTPTDGDEIYRVEYINKCPTYVEFTVSSIPLTVTPTETALETMCEGNPFSTGITIVCDETPTIKWFREGNELSGSNVSTYTIAQVKDADDGQYSYEVTNRGCKATGDAASLDAQPYIKVTNQTTPYIVPRNGSQSIPLNITVPSNGSVATIDWKENGLSVFTGNPYSVTDVVSDHAYSIELSDPDYCSDTTTATIWVDAELQLSATLTDTMCYGETKVLTIDTTGTGTFRQSGVAVILKVTETAGGTTTDITSKISKNGSNLEVQLSPTQTSTYLITFEYGSQKTSWTQSMVVLQPINLTVPATPTICEGEEATLEVTNISPVGTTISWNSDPTITSTELTEVTSVTVAPTYQGSASGSHQSTYTYTFVANFPRCETKSYTASVKVDEPLSGVINGTSPICEGDRAEIDASDYQATSYTWKNSADSVLSYSSELQQSPIATATYTVEMSRGTCKNSDSYTVTVTSKPVIESIDSVGFRDRLIVLVSGTGTPQYTYWIDNNVAEADNEATRYNLSFSTHTAHVKDANGCLGEYIFAMDPPAISIPEFFSPNGDGVNDSWVVSTLADIYPDAVVKIYDRYGKLLIEFLGDDSLGWDGTYNGKQMPSTDYWYIIDIEEIDKEYTGHFTLLRR